MSETTETIMISAKAENMLYLEKERYRTIVTQLLGAYTRAFPNYAWDDAQTAIDLMLAEITTLRWEKERYKAALDNSEIRLLNIARGCHDFGGGYSDSREMEIFHHGLQTVINSLEGAVKEPNSFQVRVLESIGDKP